MSSRARGGARRGARRRSRREPSAQAPPARAAGGAARPPRSGAARLERRAVVAVERVGVGATVQQPLRHAVRALCGRDVPAGAGGPGRGGRASVMSALVRSEQSAGEAADAKAGHALGRAGALGRRPRPQRAGRGASRCAHPARAACLSPAPPTRHPASIAACPLPQHSQRRPFVIVHAAPVSHLRRPAGRHLSGSIVAGPQCTGAGRERHARRQRPPRTPAGRPPAASAPRAAGNAAAPVASARHGKRRPKAPAYAKPIRGPKAYWEPPLTSMFHVAAICRHRRRSLTPAKKMSSAMARRFAAWHEQHGRREGAGAPVRDPAREGRGPSARGRRCRGRQRRGWRCRAWGPLPGAARRRPWPARASPHLRSTARRRPARAARAAAPAQTQTQIAA